MFDPTDPNFPNVDPVPTPIQPNFQDWTGSVGLTYALNPCLNLVCSVSEGFRAPLLDELTSVSDNVGEGGVDLPVIGLTPETSYNYEVGLKFDYERIRAQTFVFWTQLEGLIDRVVVFHDLVEDIDFYQRRNVGQAELQGVELAGELLLTPRWSTYGNLTYTYGQNLTDDEPLSRIPPTQGIIGLRWRDAEARNWFDLYAWLVARQDRLSSRDLRDTVRIPPGGTPGYATLNLRLGSFITSNQRVTLGIENIFDKAYRVHGSGVDGPGISGHFGYELFY
jgi:outer membrane receptor protein involved in Fe transport